MPEAMGHEYHRFACALRTQVVEQRQLALRIERRAGLVDEHGAHLPRV